MHRSEDKDVSCQIFPATGLGKVAYLSLVIWFIGVAGRVYSAML